MTEKPGLPACVAEWERLLALKPPHEGVAAWKGAVALAMTRHPLSPYPHPQDQADAHTVLAAAVPHVL